MPSFIFDISNTALNNSDKIPIINTGNSFIGLSTIITPDVTTTTIIITWSSYTKLDIYDGLSFNDNIVSYGNEPSINIRQFGGIVLPNMTYSNSSFNGFSGKITATDVPTINNSSLSCCFYNSPCANFGNISNWNTSNVTNMESMFYGASNFNELIDTSGNNWNTSNVTNMKNMFYGAIHFNKSISGWNTSKVTNMHYMFYGAINFNQPLDSSGNIWNTSKVTDMDNMFQDAVNFKQVSIGNWNFSRISTITNFISNTGYSLNQCFTFLINLSNNDTINNKYFGIIPGIRNSDYLTLSSIFINKLITFSTVTNIYDLILSKSYINIYTFTITFQSNVIFNGLLVGDYTNHITYLQDTTNPVKNMIILDYLHSADYVFYNDNVTLINSFSFYGTNISNIPFFNTIYPNAIEYQITMNNVSYYNGFDWSINIASCVVSNLTKLQLTDELFNIYKYPAGYLRVTGYTASELKTAGYSAGELNGGGYSATELKVANYTILSLYIGEYTATELKVAGYSVVEMKGAGYNAYQLRIAEYSASELRSANFTLEELINAGYNVSELRIAQYTASELKALGYTIIQLQSGGYTLAQLVQAEYDIFAFLFKFDISNTSLNNNLSIPVVNGSNSFIDLSSYNTENGDITTVTVAWSSYQNLNVFDGLSFNTSVVSYGNDPSINIKQFNGIALPNMTTSNNASFNGFTGKITAIDVPTISNIGLSYCFYNSICSQFGNIGNWNTSKVVNMNNMFYGAINFNQPIDTWNTSKVLNTSNMFYEAINFNQPIGSWDTSKIRNMSNMFCGATNFNKPIGNWNTSLVNDMNNMFYGAIHFNQPIDRYGNKWDTSNVTDMNGMFNDAITFNQPIGYWNTAKVVNMNNMFYNATSFNQISIASWIFFSISTINNFITNAGYSLNQCLYFLRYLVVNTTINNKSFGIIPGIRPNDFKTIAYGFTRKQITFTVPNIYSLVLSNSYFFSYTFTISYNSNIIFNGLLVADCNNNIIYLEDMTNIDTNIIVFDYNYNSDYIIANNKFSINGTNVSSIPQLKVIFPSATEYKISGNECYYYNGTTLVNTISVVSNLISIPITNRLFNKLKYTAIYLKTKGYLAPELLTAGYTKLNLIEAGYTDLEINGEKPRPFERIDQFCAGQKKRGTTRMDGCNPVLPISKKYLNNITYVTDQLSGDLVPDPNPKVINSCELRNRMRYAEYVRTYGTTKESTSGVKKYCSNAGPSFSY